MTESSPWIHNSKSQQAEGVIRVIVEAAPVFSGL
jgi:hypothetical protein